tara:strand:+ start:592 stop:732 length:141 start_codon:yes stop_codon:yes gene_type:complete
MSNDELKQYLINAGVPELRANGMVDNGFITDKASADQFIAEITPYL